MTEESVTVRARVTIGAVVRAFRLDRGMTREKLATEASGLLRTGYIDEGWIRWLELSHQGPQPPRPDYLRPVTRVLGIPWSRVLEIVGLGDEPVRSDPG